MKKPNESHPSGTGSIWPDLVSDFLEMSCFLKAEEQAFLLRELQKYGMTTETIDVHPCFSIEGRMIIVCEDIEVKECWLYFVRKQQIQKWTEIRTVEIL